MREWTDEQRAEGERLQAAWVEVAAELREAIEDSGLEAELGATSWGARYGKLPMQTTTPASSPIGWPAGYGLARSPRSSRTCGRMA